MNTSRFSVLSSIVLTLLLLIPATSFGYDILQEFSGYGPGGLAFDEGSDTLWVSDMLGQSILQVNASDGSISNTLDVSLYNDQPTGLAYYSGSLWSSDQQNYVIHEVSTSDGTSQTERDGQGGLTFENEDYFWRGPDWDSNTLLKIELSTGNTVDSIDLGLDPSSFIMGLAFDSNTGTIWAADSYTNTLLNVDLSGTILSTTGFDPNPGSGYEVGGLAFDDIHNTLWVNYADFNEGPQSNAVIYELSMTTVVPEPISSTLFIIGGATLGLRRYRRRKVQNV